MKALAKLKPEPGIWMTDVPVPEVGHNDVLIKIHRTAICGTDIHIYQWDEWSQKTVPVPLVTGHEYSGEIVELGQEVRGFQIGDRVSGEGHITCGHCRNCRAGRRHLCRNTVGVGVNRAGAFAEYYYSEMDELADTPAFWDPIPGQGELPTAVWSSPPVDTVLVPEGMTPPALDATKTSVQARTLGPEHAT